MSTDPVIDDPVTCRALDALRELVDLETPSGHNAGIRRALELVRGWADPLLRSPGSLIVASDVPHLLWEATSAPRTLLLGHVDTVWPLGTVDRRPFRVDGERATGPGVLDMKAGLVIAVEALRQADAVSSVGLLITGDEEVGSLTSRPLIERVAAAYDAVLLLEPSHAGALKTARKGGAIYQLEITGRAAHAGLAPENGVNALTELARLVMELDRFASPGEGTTVTPTVARAGVTTNTIPDHAVLNVDVRAWSDRELERVDVEIRRLSAQTDGAALQVHGGINRYPMQPDRSHHLVAIAARVARRAGLSPIEEARVGGASDGNFTSRLGVATLDGLGAVGGGAHEDGEWIAIRSLAERARLVAGMIDALAASGG